MQPSFSLAFLCWDATFCTVSSSMQPAHSYEKQQSLCTSPSAGHRMGTLKTLLLMQTWTEVPSGIFPLPWSIPLALCSTRTAQTERNKLISEGWAEFRGMNYHLELGTWLNALLKWGRKNSSGWGSWISCRLRLCQHCVQQRAPSHCIPTHLSLRGMLPWISTGNKRVHIGRTLLRLLGVNIDLTALPSFFFFKNRFVGHGWKNKMLEGAWFTLALTQTCRSVGWQLLC